MKKSSLLVLLICAVVTLIFSCTSADAPSTPPGTENGKAEQAVYIEISGGTDPYMGAGIFIDKNAQVVLGDMGLRTSLFFIIPVNNSFFNAAIRTSIS